MMKDSIMKFTKPTLADVLAARKRIAPFITPTPANNYPGLDELMGGQVWVKHENHHPTSAFKVRGGINLCAALSERGALPVLVTASTGNHGQSIAYAARLFGAQAKIYVPEASNPDKIRAIRNLGAEVIFYGKNYEVCRHRAEEMAKAEGARFIDGGNEPYLIAGVGTYTLELFEKAPDLDIVFVPVGGGSGACGCSIVAHAISPDVKIIGVQSGHAPAVYRSWKTGEYTKTDSADTFAEGLATLAPFEQPLEILRQELDDFMLVSDDELREAIRVLFTHTHNIAEGAGAAAFAAAYRIREEIQGKKIAVIMSGGNLTIEVLRDILDVS
jgi:threonine dehydratase